MSRPADPTARQSLITPARAEFEKPIWTIIDTEIDRITSDQTKFQKTGCMRADVDPALLGALVVGTYLLVGKQMVRATEKPDLPMMARSLHALINEGAVPRA